MIWWHKVPFGASCMKDLGARSCTGSSSLVQFLSWPACAASWKHGGICLQTKTTVQLQCEVLASLSQFPGLSSPLCQFCSFLFSYLHFFLRKICMWERKREDFLLRWTQWWNKHWWLSRKTRDYKANSQLLSWVLKCRNWDTKSGKCSWIVMYGLGLQAFTPASPCSPFAHLCERVVSNNVF